MPDDDNDETTEMPASLNYKAAVPAGGTVQTFTTTDILVGREGVTTIVVGTPSDDAGVAKETLGRPVPGTSSVVTIAIAPRRQEWVQKMEFTGIPAGR